MGVHSSITMSKADAKRMIIDALEEGVEDNVLHDMINGYLNHQLLNCMLIDGDYDIR